MASTHATGQDASSARTERELARVLAAFGAGSADELVRLVHGDGGTCAGISPAPSDEVAHAALRARCLRAEREVRVLRALLLMKNVEVDSGRLGAPPREFAPGAGETGELSPGTGAVPGPEAQRARVEVEELLRLRAKVKLLQQACLVLRAEVVYLRESVPSTTRWVVERAHAALANEVRQRKVLQNRIASLVKLLQ